MKFHRITVENINSLYGVQEVDFDEDLDGAPLYLIMGPTGSGKTTILDAVCLALFGETPRQTNRANSLDDIGARVNSFGTGESKAEVEFSVIEEDAGRDGARVRNRYRAGWHFRRAYEKPGATPQTPRRELFKRVEDGWHQLVSSTTKKDYEDEFEAVLGGMEMQDFLRSVMLAQGEFSALLKADAEEKASILERLTDTSVYKELGRLAQERWRSERDALEALEQEVESFEGEEESPAEKLEATRAERDDRQAILEGLEAWHQDAVDFIDWLQRRTELREEHADTARELEAGKAEKREHNEDFERLERDQEARNFGTSPRRVEELESELDEIGEKIEALEGQKKERNKAVDEADKALEAAEKDLEEAEQNYRDKKDDIEEGKRLETRLEDLRGRRKDSLSAARESADEVREARREFEDARDDVREAEAELEETVREVVGADVSKSDDASWSERLQEELGRCERKLQDTLGDASTPKEKRDRLNERNLELSKARSTVDDVEEAEGEIAKLGEKLSDLGEQKKELEASLAELKEEAESRKDALESEKKQKAQLDLELRAVDLRRELQEGDDCPVCGSDEHPKLQHTHGGDEAAIDADEAELQQERDCVEERISELEDELERLRKKKQKKANKIAQIEGTVDNTSEQLQTQKKRLETLGDTWADQTEGWDTDVEFGNVDAMRDACRMKVEQLEARRESLDSAEEAVDTLVDAKEAHDQAVGNLEEAQKDYDREVEDGLDDAMNLYELEFRVRELDDSLETMFGGQTPSKREAELQKAVDKKRKQRDEAKEAASEAKKALAETTTELKTTQKQQKKVAEDLKQKRESLKAEIEASETFDDLDAVRSALLEEKERKELKERCEKIQGRIDSARQALERLNDELAEHCDGRPARLDPEVYKLEALKEAKRRLDEAIGETNQKIGALDNTIETLERRLEEYHEKKEQLDAQREEFGVWDELRSLIGVGGGEKFKQFAQALNLDRIVDRANGRLGELHERYKLRTKRDESGLPKLDFEILDEYHAGKPRPLSTLSGGETFLVSLALALALADQQEVEMPIETLFLDEGFGTLDRDSLRKAMEILNNLQGQGGEGGRTVGVISHVEALQEQIADQVIVEPQQKGRSEIKVSPAGS